MVMPTASSSSRSNPNSLKRNQACHQCRKRKLKCDAKKPACSACVRSHAYTVAHPPPGTMVSPDPTCTFDLEPTVSEINIPPSVFIEDPKDRFEQLERRINQLEALLQESSASERSDTPPERSGTASGSSVVSPGSLNIESPSLGGGFSYETFYASTSAVSAPDLAMDFQNFDTSGLAALANAASLGLTPEMGHINGSDSAFVMQNPLPEMELLPYAWPPNLPGPALLRHLVEALFAFDIDAPRLFHGPSFLTKLTLPPNHPEFPDAAVLHAMCAVGSLYTAVVEPHPSTLAHGINPEELFEGKVRESDSRPDSFAEQQARYAHELCIGTTVSGGRLFETLQATILLTEWYWQTAKWTQCYVSVSLALRCCGPLQLNSSPQFPSLEWHPPKAPLLNPPANVIEAELRRNAFWIAYGMERMMGCGHGWALMLDDEDISQLMPLRVDQYEQGTFVPSQSRQWSHERDILLRHPVDQTDAFVLRVKSSILLSRVKTFNMRFRSRYYLGDPAIVDAYRTADGIDRMEARDPRQTPAFIEIDQLVSSFVTSFPSHLRNPVEDETINPHLFIACSAPHLAQILLHESHALIGHPSCVSSHKVLHASRQILNLFYSICATSYDPLLLGPFGTLCSFMAGRIFVRFLQAAIESNAQEQILQLRLEIEFIRTVITQQSEKSPLAVRYTKMLHDGLIQSCGEAYAEPLPITTTTGASSTTPDSNSSGNATEDLLNDLLGSDSL